MALADAQSESPAKRFGAPELAWLLNRRLWVAVLMPGLLTIGMLFLLGILPEGRLLNPLEQYKGVAPGDLFLWLGTGSALVLAIRYFDPCAQGRGYKPRHWRMAAIVAAVLLSLLLTGGEIHAIFTNPHGAATYTWPQFWSPTHLAHTVVVPLMAYINVRLLAVLFFARKLFYRSDQRWAAFGKVLVVAGWLGWFVCAIILDNFVFPRPDLANIHPLDGGWFGGWWPGVFEWLSSLWGW